MNDKSYNTGPAIFEFRDGEFPVLDSDNPEPRYVAGVFPIAPIGAMATTKPGGPRCESAVLVFAEKSADGWKWRRLGAFSHNYMCEWARERGLAKGEWHPIKIATA